MRLRGRECPDEIKYTVEKVLYGIALIVIGIILAALHFIVAGKGIGFLVVALVVVGLVFNASGVKDVLLQLFNKIIGA